MEPRTAQENEEKLREAQAQVSNLEVVSVKQQQLTDAQGDEAVRKCKADLLATIDREMKRVLQVWSVSHVPPAAWSLPFGAHKGGVNSATPSDMLHQFSLGLMKRAFKNLAKLIKNLTKAAVFPKMPKKMVLPKLPVFSTVVKKRGTARKEALERKDAAKGKKSSRTSQEKWMRSNERLTELYRRMAAMNTRHNGTRTLDHVASRTCTLLLSLRFLQAPEVFPVMR
jgi:hypothetical protein